MGSTSKWKNSTSKHHSLNRLISNANEITEMFEKAGRKEEADEMRDKVREMTEVKESFEKMFNMDLSLP